MAEAHVIAWNGFSEWQQYFLVRRAQANRNFHSIFRLPAVAVEINEGADGHSRHGGGARGPN